MKKFIIVFMLLCFTNAVSQVSKEHKSIAKYFGKNEFSIDSQEYIINGKKMYLARHYVNNQKKLFDNAVVYSKEGSKIKIELYFENNLVLDVNRKEVMNIKLPNRRFYAWGLHFDQFPGWDKYENGFSLVYYSNDGKDVADNIYVLWSKKDSKFVEVGGAEIGDYIMDNE